MRTVFDIVKHIFEIFFDDEIRVAKRLPRDEQRSLLDRRAKGYAKTSISFA